MARGVYSLGIRHSGGSGPGGANDGALRPPLPTVEPRLGESYAVGEKAASARAEPLLDEALPLRMILRSRQFALLLTMYGICGFQDFS